MQISKRFWIFPLFFSAVLWLSGCAQVNSAMIQAGFAPSPYYHLGDTQWDHGGVEEYWFNQIPSELNETYRELYSRLSNQEDEGELYAGVPTETFWTVYHAVLADHPEFFWIDSNIEVTESGLTGEVIAYKAASNLPVDQRESVRMQLEAAADECIRQIPQDASDYEKIKAVYEYLIDTVDYQRGSVNNQNIQSALLEKRSVCAGYSKAFQYILHRMGMFCTYVTGRTVSGDDHAWNIVRIDGQYYNVDVTWGDPVFVGQQEQQQTLVTSYNYLCCSDAQLSATHIPEADFALPSCSDESYDYYRMNGLYYEYFDYDTVYSALMNSVWEERRYVTFKFGSKEAYDSAMYEFFSNGMLQDPAQYLMDLYGLNTWNYRYNTEEEFHLITIYWRSE